MQLRTKLEVEEDNEDDKDYEDDISEDEDMDTEDAQILVNISTQHQSLCM